jgi:hypothetical protein
MKNTKFGLEIEKSKLVPPAIHVFSDMLLISSSLCLIHSLKNLNKETKLLL